ncbi:meiosis-specific coiled-coil domain-containing protein MEIOC [Pelobates fuscus]|uniref:meiosis-specific coiled-coil domain-containing protein MEIOC n=1 Tax=Pelobates fuscus TaxID=191477 RepID=UPI002FE4A62D
MEYKTASRLNGLCWNNLDASSKQLDVFNSNVCTPTAFYDPYEIQNIETSAANPTYESSAPTTSSDYSTNSSNASLFNTPWSTHGDEVKQTSSLQIKNKIQDERNEYDSEMDLYGLVSNILEEPEKTHPYLNEGVSPSIVKSVWSLNGNRLCEHQDFQPDLKKPADMTVLPNNFYENISSTETQKMEEFYDGLSVLVQDDQWLYSCITNNASSCNDKSELAFHEYPFDKNGSRFSAALPEASKDNSQKRADLSQFDRYSTDTDLGQYDFLNSNKTKQGKFSTLNLQDYKKAANGNMLPGLDTNSYSKLFQVAASCPKQDSIMPEQQNYKFQKAMLLDRACQKDSSFTSDFSTKSDYGLKASTMLEGNIGLAGSQHTLHQQDSQNSDYKPFYFVSSVPGANSVRSPWINGLTENNSSFTYYGNSTVMASSGNLSASNKNSCQNSNYSIGPSSLASADTSFQKYCHGNTAFPVFEYSFNGKENMQRGPCKNVDDRLFNAMAERKFSAFCENMPSYYKSLDSTGKQNMQYSTEKNLESVCKNDINLIENTVNNKCHTQQSGDGILNSSRLPCSKTGCFSNTLMMGEMQPNKCNQVSSANYKSHFSHNLGHPVFPIVDCHETYTHEDLGQMYPHVADLIHGESTFSSITPVLSQRPIKSRSMPESEIHIWLENCYEQLRAMEKERKKTESILVKHYPGKKVSSSNNIPIPRLSTNPSRVDRLIVDQLREQARVATLFGKMERFHSSPLSAYISTTLDHHLETIHIVQAHRKDEITNASNRQRPGASRHQDDRGIFVLASSIKELSRATCNTRTALCCALQMTLLKTQHKDNTRDLEKVDQNNVKA